MALAPLKMAADMAAVRILYRFMVVCGGFFD
jgi:hypothetical protein